MVYTAHSVPVSMAESSPYERQLREVCARVNATLGLPEPVLVYQSRSGPPSQSWLEPDVGEYIRGTASRKLVVVPIGFLSDHMEVLYDLDTEAAVAAKERGIGFVRAGTAGTHPRFVSGIREMVQSALVSTPGYVCLPDCCKPGAKPARQA